MSTMPRFITLDLVARGGRYMTTPLKESQCRQAAEIVAKYSNSTSDCIDLLCMLGLLEDNDKIE